VLGGKRKIRLGVNTLFLVPGDVGGTETFLRESLKALATYHSDCFDFVLFTNNENHAILKEDLAGCSSLNLYKLGFNASNRPARIVFEQTWLALACRKANLDLLWSPGYTAPFWSPCPQTVTIPDLQYKRFPEDMTWLERVTFDILIKIACRRCAAIFTISEFSKKEVIKYNFADKNKIFPVLLGVDQSFGKQIPEEDKNYVLEELQIFKAPYILCVAHSYPHKNIDVLIEAFNLVLDKIPHNLVIVGRPRRGEGAVRSAIDRMSDRIRLVRFSEGVPYRSLQVLYQESDLFVLPSAYEGFGLPVIEAMMAGTPVVTSREGSLEEVGGKHAFYVSEITAKQIAETIMSVLECDSKSRLLSVKKAKEWSKLFTWKRSASKMSTIFQKTLSEQVISRSE